jgi:hypothetical protein
LFENVNNVQPDVDVGYRTDRFSFSGASQLTWQAGATIRYLLSPQFTLPARPKRELIIGQNPPTLRDFTFRLKPELDTGGQVEGDRWLAGVELHNLFGTNGGDMSIHVGAEYTPIKWVSVRGGYDQDRFVYGIGLNIGPVSVDAAAGQDYRKLISVGVRTQF